MIAEILDNWAVWAVMGLVLAIGAALFYLNERR